MKTSHNIKFASPQKTPYGVVSSGLITRILLWQTFSILLTIEWRVDLQLSPIFIKY